MKSLKIFAAVLTIVLAVGVFYANACDNSKSKTKAGVENSVEMKKVSGSEGCCSDKTVKTAAKSDGCCSSKTVKTAGTEGSCSSKTVKTAGTEGSCSSKTVKTASNECSTKSACSTEKVKLEAKNEAEETNLNTAEIVTPETK